MDSSVLAFVGLRELVDHGIPANVSVENVSGAVKSAIHKRGVTVTKDVFVEAVQLIAAALPELDFDVNNTTTLNEKLTNLIF